MSSLANEQDSEPPPGDATGNRRKKDPLLGRTINGRFRILSVIARGGMGKVYQAEQTPLGRICAVKVLNPKYDGDEDPEFQRRFYLEASTASKLTHPNTVTIFDYGRDEENDLYFIAMEYVRGRTLFRILREDGTLAEHRVAHIMRQVGRSLREAHGLGVIHRDMKPANVVVVEGADEKDGVKVLDFGLVKDVSGDDPEDLTQQGLFMGSPKYMAPEQILGNAVSAATDIYSLGVVAYELLTGEVPFDKGASVKTLMAHVNERPRPMQRVNPNIYLSAEMSAIVMCCLAKEPEERYQSMDELLRALTKVEGGGTLTDSLLAGPVVRPPTSVSHRDIYGMLPDAAPDPMDSNPTRPIHRSPDSMPSAGSTSASTIPVNPALGAHELSTAPASTAPASTAPASTAPASTAPASTVPPDSARPDSILPSALIPSDTPQPLEQLALDDLAMPKRSSAPIRVAIGVVAVVTLAALVFAFRQPTTDTEANASAADETSEAGDTTPAVGANPTAASSVRTVRTVQVTSSPPGAKVMQGDKVLCGATPCQITWDGDDATQSQQLELSLDGHAPQTITVSADATEIAGALTRNTPKPNVVRPPPRTPAQPPPREKSPAPKPAVKPKPLSGYKDSPY